MATYYVRGRRLYVDLMYRGVRCQEATGLVDSQDNRAEARRRARQIDGEIAGGRFDYARWFPRGKRGHLFAAPGDEGPTKYVAHVRQWIDEKAARVAPGTAYDQRRIIEARLIPAFGERLVSAIDVHHVEAFVAGLLTPKGEEKKLSHRRANIILQVLRQSLDRAVRRGWLKDNPARLVDKLREEKPDIDPLSFDEVTTLLGKGLVAPSWTPQDVAGWRRYFTVAFFTGLRPGEQMGLRLDDLDWIRKTIGVRRAVGRFGEGPTKTVDSRRDVEMLPTVERALRAQRAAVQLRGGWLFPNRDGKPLNLTNVRERVWRPALRRAGLRYRSFYQTRHTFVTLMLGAGESPAWIARQLGHTTPEMLFRRYHRFIPNLTRRDGSAASRWLEERGL